MKICDINMYTRNKHTEYGLSIVPDVLCVIALVEVMNFLTIDMVPRDGQ